MSGSALADRLRAYVRERRDKLAEIVLSDNIEDWTAYKTAVGRIDELDGVADEVTEIMKDINSGV